VVRGGANSDDQMGPIQNIEIINGTIGPATFSLPLSLAQDLTQIQIRVRESASAFNVGDLASAGFNISDIKVEVQTPQQPNMIVLM
jgi:hypothetical protein